MYETAGPDRRIARFRAASSHRMMREMAGFVREQKNNQTNESKSRPTYGVWKIRLPGTARRCGPDPKASIITLGNHILHAAGEDADRLGFGLRWMQSNNTTWVLSRMAIEMDRYPDEYEHYKRTWVSDINRLMTTVTSSCMTGRATPSAKAVPIGSMIDFKTRRRSTCALWNITWRRLSQPIRR